MSEHVLLRPVTLVLAERPRSSWPAAADLLLADGEVVHADLRARA